MKSLTFVSSAALVHLAAGQSTPVAPPVSTATVFFTDGKPTATWSAPAPGSTGNSGAAICGQGFTYCGYILRDHQNFREEDIVRVYCASAKDNCANGKTKSDPLQALYVCLPPQSQAIPVPNGLVVDSYNDDDSPHPDSQDTHFPLQPHAQNNRGGSGSGNYNKNVHGLRNRRQAAASTSPAAAAPSSPGGLTSGGGSGTCSSTPTTGNQLALLCSCGNKCLNPKEDHIGRCDTPCSQ